MKTPRELLLERHRAAGPELDRIRRSVLSAAVHPEPSSARANLLPVRVALKLWFELIWPARRTWAGLAVVWVVLLFLHLGSRDDDATLAVRRPLPTPEVRMALQKQERLMAELLGTLKSGPAEPSKPALPGPRSDRRRELMLA